MKENFQYNVFMPVIYRKSLKWMSQDAIRCNKMVEWHLLKIVQALFLDKDGSTSSSKPYNSVMYKYILKIGHEGLVFHPELCLARTFPTILNFSQKIH